MKTAFLLRDELRPDCIRGTLFVDGKEFQTLERLWVNNERKKSCIPTGIYETQFMPRSASGKYKNVFHVQDVPDRGGILIHNGNVVDHSLGCILVGKKRGVLAGKSAVLNSKSALRELNDTLGKEDFKLVVVGGYE